MYFVPLVSPNEVHPHLGTNNTQEVHLHPPSLDVAGDHFELTCGIEIRGEGYLRNAFDHRGNVARNAEKLRAGGVLERQLDEITIEGSGRGDIRVRGTLSNQTARVLEVELRFDGHGQPSPVTIGLVDLDEVGGSLRRRNEQVARVQSLAFRASTGAVARMHVRVGSVTAKDSGGGLFQRIGGAVTGFAANLFLKPIRVDPAGHAAMLRLGATLAAGRVSFTFPPAKALPGASRGGDATGSPPQGQPPAAPPAK